MATLTIEDFLDELNTEFKGLEFEYANYNTTYEQFELHFKVNEYDSKYITIGYSVKPALATRIIQRTHKSVDEVG